MTRSIAVTMWAVVGLIAFCPLLAQEGAWPVPDAARAMKNPVPLGPEAVQAGSKLYEAHCLRCHGAKGLGDGPAAQFIKPAPTEISSAETQKRMSDGEIFYKITEGKKPMPAMKTTLSDEQRWHLVHFVRTFRPEARTTERASRDQPQDAQQVVATWFARWNALDGTPAATEALVQMYEPDALHSTGPASHQMGTVTYQGHDGIRKMAMNFVAASEKPAFRIEAVTAMEKTAQLFNTVPGPWGGPSVAVEYAAAYTSRQDGKRYYYPGAAFFQIRDGKIRRLRLYMASGELAEVEPDGPRRRP